MSNDENTIVPVEPSLGQQVIAAVLVSAASSLAFWTMPVVIGWSSNLVDKHNASRKARREAKNPTPSTE